MGAVAITVDTESEAPPPEPAPPRVPTWTLIGFAIGFPESVDAPRITYEVNNVYWTQEHGTG